MAENQNLFDGERKVICAQCGSPSIRKQMASGSTYIVSIMEKYLSDYFSSREDIDDFLRDRLRRAERIIEELRQEVRKNNDEHR